MQRLTRGEAADALREQAASCRRLAQKARTQRGSSALATVAAQFDEDASRLDPPSRSHWSFKDHQ